MSRLQHYWLLAAFCILAAGVSGKYVSNEILKIVIKYSREFKRWRSSELEVYVNLATFMNVRYRDPSL